MKRISLIAPNGDMITTDTVSAMTSIIDSCDEEYWSSGSGEAAIEYQGDRRAICGIRFSKMYGYSIEQRHFQEQGHWGPPFISWCKKQNDDVASVLVGGDELKLPVHTFLDPLLAKKVVADFCETGNRSKAIEWKKTSDIPKNMYG